MPEWGSNRGPRRCLGLWGELGFEEVKNLFVGQVKNEAVPGTSSSMGQFVGERSDVPAPAVEVDPTPVAVGPVEPHRFPQLARTVVHDRLATGAPRCIPDRDIAGRTEQGHDPICDVDGPVPGRYRDRVQFGRPHVAYQRSFHAPTLAYPSRLVKAPESTLNQLNQFEPLLLNQFRYDQKYWTFCRHTNWFRNWFA